MARTVPRMLLLFVGLPIAVSLVLGTSIVPILVAYAAWFGLAIWGARDGTGRRRRKSVPLSAIAFLLMFYVGLPVAFASVVGASWRGIGAAYAIWFGMLALWAIWGRSRGVARDAATGWPLIIAMFLTMVVVPVLALVFRIAGFA